MPLPPSRLPVFFCTQWTSPFCNWRGLQIWHQDRTTLQGYQPMRLSSSATPSHGSSGKANFQEEIVMWWLKSSKAWSWRKNALLGWFLENCALSCGSRPKITNKNFSSVQTHWIPGCSASVWKPLAAGQVESVIALQDVNQFLWDFWKQWKQEKWLNPHVVHGKGTRQHPSRDRHGPDCSQNCWCCLWATSYSCCWMLVSKEVLVLTWASAGGGRGND